MLASKETYEVSARYPDGVLMRGSVAAGSLEAGENG